VITDLLIAPVHPHVTDLALAVIVERSVIGVLIKVPMPQSTDSGEQENVRVVARRGDSVLDLTSESSVDVGAPVVHRPDNKAMVRDGVAGCQILEERPLHYSIMP